jgi:hypothetical protein
VAALEALLWPAKLESESLPTFIVPIRAEWAQHFFDEELAAELLLGLREDGNVCNKSTDCENTELGSRIVGLWNSNFSLEIIWTHFQRFELCGIAQTWQLPAPICLSALRNALRRGTPLGRRGAPDEGLDFNGAESKSPPGD